MTSEADSPSERPLPPEKAALSIFQGGLIGFGIAVSCALMISLVKAVGAGDYQEPVAFQLMFCLGGLGAVLGCDITARLRKKRNPDLPPDEFKTFMRSPVLFLLIGLVLVLAFLLSAATGMAFHVASGRRLGSP
jgi:hypothetical protein